MRPITWNLTITLLCVTDLLSFTEGYTAKPIIRRISSSSNSISLREGRRFFPHSTSHSSSSSSLIGESSESAEFVLGKPFSGLIGDFKRRLPHYKSDWTDGFKKKSLAAILFLYFACLGEHYRACYCYYYNFNQIYYCYYYQ